MMKKHTGEKGATLIELISGLAVTALIMCGVLGLIYQEWSGTATAKTQVTAAHEIGAAARLLSQDGAMAESTNLTEGAQPLDYLTLTWVERREFADFPHYCSYWLEGTRLCRDYDGTVTTVAQHISKVEFSQSGRLLAVSIYCTPRWWILDTTVERTYHIYLRPTVES